MTTIRSHLTPDVIEGIRMGDVVYFHVTNLEQDWDVPHGFAIKGNNNAEMLIMPGETQTLRWEPTMSVSCRCIAPTSARRSTRRCKAMCG